MEEVQQQALITLLVGIVLTSMVAAAIFVTTGGRQGAAARHSRGDFLVEVLAIWIVLIPVYIGIGGVLQELHLQVGITVSQLGLLLAPCLLLTRWWRLSPRELLGLKGAPLTAALGAVALGLGMWAPIGLYLSAQELLFPMPEALTQMFEDQILPDTPAELALAVLVFAAVPALAEETLFRGLLLPLAVPRLGKGGAIALTAVLFGVTHLTPQRIIPTALLGVVLGWLRIRTGSLLPAVLLHLTHNAVLLGAGAHLESLEPSAGLPWMAGALLSLAIGFYLLGWPERK